MPGDARRLCDREIGSQVTITVAQGAGQTCSSLSGIPCFLRIVLSMPRNKVDRSCQNSEVLDAPFKAGGELTTTCYPCMQTRQMKASSKDAESMQAVADEILPGLFRSPARQQTSAGTAPQSQASSSRQVFVFYRCSQGSHMASCCMIPDLSPMQTEKMQNAFWIYRICDGRPAWAELRNVSRQLGQPF